MFKRIFWMASLLLAGCIQTETLIQVRPDGTGLLRETVLLRKDVAESMRQMAQGLEKPSDKKGETPLLFDPKALEKKAQQLGEGVYLILAKPLETEEGEGYRAIYGFNDIRTLRIDQHPQQPGESQQPPSPPEYITFDFTPGDPARLVVHLPEPSREEEKPASPEQVPAERGDEKALEMLKGMFKGFHVRVAVEPLGVIASTNATHREGNQIPLLDIDFDALLSSPEKLKELAERQPRSMSELKELLKEVPGIKVQLENPLVIEFRPGRVTMESSPGSSAG
ncbi:MAG: hypothetical protein D6819_04530 [Gammaproteobacteria bacterium]|nr:MAG: hypothetical protein D6819_04530 [Gammaproteobacteria bacterium]